MKRKYINPATDIYSVEIQTVLFGTSAGGDRLDGGGNQGNYDPSTMTQESRRRDVWGDDEDDENF